MYIKKIILIFFITSFCIGAGSLGALWYVLEHPILNMIEVDNQFSKKPSIILDIHGKEIGKFKNNTYEFVSIHRIPLHVINAFIAAEDWNFFNHPGLSFKGIIRSILVNLYHGKKMQGASTITQQLVKLHFFDSKKTFNRKFKEQLYALLIERQYSKEQILEYYLNSVYFGPNIYGVQTACQKFWNKNIEEISQDEAALLAAIICSPGNYFPSHYPLSAQKRRNIILNKMEKLHFITHELCTQLQAIPVSIQDHNRCENELPIAVREYIRTSIETFLDKKVLEKGGLVIQTTLDSEIQKKAENTIKEYRKKLRLLYGGDLDGALVTLDVATQQIRAIVTGFDYETSYYNRVFSAKRQQGSIFKPLIYAAALEAGISFCDTAVDEPLTINFNGKTWEPRNYNRTFAGSMTLARALTYSNNIISIKVLLNIGAEKIVELAKRCHFSGEIFPYPSLALGCIDSPLIEVASFFSTLAHNGIYNKPSIISFIQDDLGKKIYSTKPESERVISSKITSQINKVLCIGLKNKKNSSSVWIDSDAISKTGTTNDSRTCWFVGSTPELTTAIYVGCDDNRPMGIKVFPLHTAFQIWIHFHAQLLTHKKHFIYDPLLQSVYVNSKTGEFCDTLNSKDIYQLLV